MISQLFDRTSASKTASPTTSSSPRMRSTFQCASLSLVDAQCSRKDTCRTPSAAAYSPAASTITASTPLSRLQDRRSQDIRFLQPSGGVAAESLGVSSTESAGGALMMLLPPPHARASALWNNSLVPGPKKPFQDANTPLPSPLQGAHLTKEAHLHEGGMQQMRLFERQYAIMTSFPANFLDQKVRNAPSTLFSFAFSSGLCFCPFGGCSMTVMTGRCTA